MTVESNVEDTALLSKADKTAEEHIELQQRAYLTSKTLRALEKEVDALRHAYDAGDLDSAGTGRYGIYLVLLGHHHEAIDVLSEHEGESTATFFRGRALRELGRYRLAVAALEPIAGANELFAGELVESMIAADQLEEAAKVVDKQMAKSANKAEVAYLRGLMADAAGEYAEAREFYRGAIDGESGHVKARFRLAFNNDLRGDEDEAREGYESLLECMPPHANALINLGVMYEDAGEYNAAVDCYERILEVYPAHERARLFLMDAEASIHEVVDEDRERRNDELTQKLRIPITDFELSVRSRNCLAKMEIKTLGDLVKKTESELLSYKNFGETSLAEIKEILNSKNLRLGMSVDGPEASRMYGASLERRDEEDEDDPAAEVLDKPIDFLELSVRSRKAMDRLAISVVGELTQLTEANLMSQKNFGQTSMNEVKSKLAQYGLKLRD